ncbi:MAG TPA: tetratricopeptide repeat protein [Gemmataceae bacterium]|nr:tetratricopeptide repeat protein [Gemmataceae bacterium]
MPPSARPWPAALGLPALAAPLVLLTLTAPLGAQEPAAPTPFVPLRPETRKELDYLEAVRLYARGLLHERDNRLIEALRAFERAARLDPDSAPVHKALVPLYLALDRTDDALAACRKALELDPNDYDSWQLLARQLRAQNRIREAAQALARAIACPGLKDHPDLLAQLWFELGLLHESVQDYAAAEAALRRVAGMLDNPKALLEHTRLTQEEIDLQAAETYERLGRVCLKAGRPDEAAAAFRRAQAKDPVRAGQLSYNLAEVYLAQGRRAEALACLDAYLETRPQGTEAYEAKIKILRELGRADEIVPALQRYAGHDRHNLALQLLLAREYHLAGQSAQAEQEYDRLIRESPSPEVYRGLFEVYRRQGRTGMAKILSRLNHALNQAAPPPPRRPGQEPAPGSAAEAAKARAMLLVLRDDPELVKGLLPLVADQLLVPDGMSHQARLLFATLAARARQLEDAERLYRSCLENRLRFEGRLRGQEAQVYSGLLRVLWQARKYEAIVEVCEDGLANAQATSRVLFHVDMARALAQLGKMEAAIEQADAAVGVAREEDRLFCRRVRAQVLAEAGRHDQAVAECEAMLREFTQPGDIREIRYTLSTVYSLAKNYPKAEEQLQLILRADPDDATACNDLGYIWADQGKNLEEAERLIRKALELDRKQRTSGTALSADSDQDNAAYVDSLGWVLFRRGDLAGARRELERAAALPDGSDDPVVWDHLGDVYFRLGEPARARAAWQKAVALYETGRRRPADDRYREIQQKIKLLGRE